MHGVELLQSKYGTEYCGYSGDNCARSVKSKSHFYSESLVCSGGINEKWVNNFFSVFVRKYWEKREHLIRRCDGWLHSAGNIVSGLPRLNAPRSSDQIEKLDKLQKLPQTSAAAAAWSGLRAQLKTNSNRNSRQRQGLFRSPPRDLLFRLPGPPNRWKSSHSETDFSSRPLFLPAWRPGNY